MRAGWSLAEAAAAIRERRVSSEELTRACLDRIEQIDPHVNAFIRVRAQAAIAEARAADQALASGQAIGLLHGVPIAYKDMFHRAGEVSTFGSHPRNHLGASDTATVLTRLAGAGAISLGTLNMAEFASNPTGHNIHRGDCRNPWNTDYVTGGSSSGSAAAVAARLVYGSLGSDTGGSIRLPAAFCGVTGLKPTQTRVSRFGVLPLAPSFDVVGPLARTAHDCALLLSVIAGADPNDPGCSARAVPDYASALGRGIRGLRIGVPEESFFAAIAADVAACIDEAVRVLAQLGAAIARIPVARMSSANALQTVMQRTEASMLHAERLRSQYGDFDPHVRDILEAGLAIPATLYAEAMTQRGAFLSTFLRSTLSRVQILATPTVGIGAPTRADTAYNSPARAGILKNIAAYTRPFSYLGLPSLSVPCGFDARGLPVGLQLIGAPFDELNLLRAGDAYQSVTTWHRDTPRIGDARSIS
ncbi:MAG: amidase [Betaproteobacteria bacterium]|nr:MAG: amidase [Betaproteobacteria bacterium]